MSYIVQKYLTIFGQPITGITVPIGSTVNWNLEIQDPETREPEDLTNANVVLALSALDLKGNPIRPALIARQADVIGSPTDGRAMAPWADGDTAPPDADPFSPGKYGLEVWIEDVDGNRLQTLMFTVIDLTPASYLPNDPITALPAQDPLGLGPQGPKGDKGDTGDQGPPGETFPDQSGHDGQYLTTDGLDVSWGDPVPPVANLASAVIVEDPAGTRISRKLTLDDLAPAFAISSFAANGFSTTKEVGDTIANPAFTATYNQTPSVASLDDGAGGISLSSPFTSFAYGAGPLPARTYSKSTPNQTVVWTLSATGSATATRTITAAWRARVYYGTQTPGTLNAGFITGLPSSGLQSGFAGTYVFSSGSNTKKMYLAFPASFGTPATFKDHATGFAVPFSLVATVSVTNGFSVALSYSLYASDDFINAGVTVDVT